MESNNYSNHPQKKRNFSGFAVFLICIGSLFLLFNLNILPKMLRLIILSWQMLIIAIGIWNLVSKKNYTSGLVLIIIGSFFIYPKMGIFLPYNILKIDMSTYWPLILIIIGLYFIFNRSKNSSRRRQNDMQFDNESDVSDLTSYIDKNIMFNSSEQIILSQNFKGGNARVTFGDLIIDLRKAKLAAGTYLLEANAIFGSITIYVPSDWIVDVQGSSIFGSFDDKRHVINADNMEYHSTLVIKGNSWFAGVETKN